MDNSSPNTGKSGTTLKANPGPQKAKNEKEVQKGGGGRAEAQCLWIQN
jgi:hypothetical protein